MNRRMLPSLGFLYLCAVAAALIVSVVWLTGEAWWEGNVRLPEKREQRASYLERIGSTRGNADWLIEALHLRVNAKDLDGARRILRRIEPFVEEGELRQLELSMDREGDS